jgi:hypothetical protein
LSRAANSTSVNDIISSVQQAYGQLTATLQMPAYVWVGMVLLAAAGLCYSLTIHTRAELRLAVSERQQIAAEVARIELENARLARQLDAVEKDARTIETLAREAGMVSADETVLLLENRLRTTAKTGKQDR